jgi:hypothetical protein
MSWLISPHKLQSMDRAGKLPKEKKQQQNLGRKFVFFEVNSILLK